MRTVFMRFPDGKAKAVTFSYDDGVPQDIRLAQLFDTYGLKGTFNLICGSDGHHRFSPEEIQEHFLSRGHEIACHGAAHRANGNIRPIEGIREALDSRLGLEKLCGCIIRGYAYPDTGISQMGSLGKYEDIKQYLTELDIAYGRSHAGDNDSFTLPEDFHAWMPSAHHNNPDIMGYIDRFLAIDTTTNTWHARRTPRLLYIWGHSYEFDRDNNWDHMEEVCRRISGSEEIWYATNIEICDYVTAYKRLIYSADGHKIYNPSLQPVWLDVDGEIFCATPGQTIQIP